MICPKCGKKVPDGHAFCVGCGTKLTAAVEPPQRSKNPDADPGMWTEPISGRERWDPPAGRPGQRSVPQANLRRQKKSSGRWPMLVAAAAVALLGGIAVGVFLFGNDADSSAKASEQYDEKIRTISDDAGLSDRGETVEGYDYSPGLVSAIKKDFDDDGAEEMAVVINKNETAAKQDIELYSAGGNEVERTANESMDFSKIGSCLASQYDYYLKRNDDRTYLCVRSYHVLDMETSRWGMEIYDITDGDLDLLSSSYISSAFGGFTIRNNGNVLGTYEYYPEYGEVMDEAAYSRAFWTGIDGLDEVMAPVGLECDRSEGPLDGGSGSDRFYPMYDDSDSTMSHICYIQIGGEYDDMVGREGEIYIDDYTGVSEVIEEGDKE